MTAVVRLFHHFHVAAHGNSRRHVGGQIITAEIELPVVIQRGQEERTISVALGYGRKLVGKAGQNVGVNAYPLVTRARGLRLYSVEGIALGKTGRREVLAPWTCVTAPAGSYATSKPERRRRQQRSRSSMYMK